MDRCWRAARECNTCPPSQCNVWTAPEPAMHLLGASRLFLARASRSARPRSVPICTQACRLRELARRSLSTLARNSIANGRREERSCRTREQSDSKERLDNIDDLVRGIQHRQIVPLVESETRMGDIESDHVPHAHVRGSRNL